MLSFKKEKKVAKLVRKHSEIVAECLTTGSKAIHSYVEGNLDNAKALAKEVDEIEHRADDMLREIRDQLYSGAFLPLIREDVYKLLEAIDKVANAGEGCCDFFLSQRPDVPETLRAAFVDVVDASFGSARPLVKAMDAYFTSSGEIDEVRACAKEVSLQESVVDTKEWELTRAIFESTIDLSQKIHLRQALSRIVEISDRAENASDQIQLVSLKSVI